MTKFTHTARNSMFDRKRVWSLGDEALHWTDDRGQWSIPYSDIARVRLITYANFGGDQYQCTLSVRGAGKTKIRSHHYAGLSKFQDRSETYAPLVRELLPRVAAASPEAEFLAGGLGYQIMWGSLLVAFVVIVVLLGFALIGGMPATFNNIIIIVGMLAAIPFVWREMRKNRGYAFDPANPPEDLVGN